MPCDSSYMNPSNKELEISRVACLLDEIKGIPINRSHWDGYHPLVYNRKFNDDKMVRELCSKLRSLDVTKFSLEMQMWWRDHQIADAKRNKSTKA